MGFGSERQQHRKDFRKLAGKSDWKSVITDATKAQELLNKLKEVEKINPLMVLSYASDKVFLLTNYIASYKKKPQTLRQYEGKA